MGAGSGHSSVGGSASGSGLGSGPGSAFTPSHHEDVVRNPKLFHFFFLFVLGNLEQSSGIAIVSSILVCGEGGV